MMPLPIVAEVSAGGQVIRPEALGAVAHLIGIGCDLSGGRRVALVKPAVSGRSIAATIVPIIVAAVPVAEPPSGQAKPETHA